jgi:hypothetical protein
LISPLICPPPEPADRDCPLYDARLAIVGEDAALRRTIVREARSHVSFAELIAAEAAEKERSAARPALPAPAPELSPLPFLKHVTKEGTP